MPTVRTTEGEGTGSPAPGPLLEGLARAMKFWEPRRLLYNVLLAAVVAGWVVGTWPHFRLALTAYAGLQLAVLALIANVLYSAAYFVEIVLQLPGLPPAWSHLRSTIWVLGTVLAILVENYWIADEIYPFVR